MCSDSKDCWHSQWLFQVWQLGIRASRGQEGSLEPMVHTHLAAGAFVAAGPVADIHIVMRPVQVARARANFRLTGSHGGPDCQCALLWLPTLILGVYMQ